MFTDKKSWASMTSRIHAGKKLKSKESFSFSVCVKISYNKVKHLILSNQSKLYSRFWFI